MLDEDRGTYSPPTEDNLSFETRRYGPRDQAPITLIVSGILLVVLLLAVVLFYNSGLNSHGHVAPDVGNAVGDLKDAKVEDAKPLSDQDMNAADGAGDTSGAAQFAPSTEAPVLRDSTVQPPPVSVAPPPVAPIKGPLPSQTGNAALTPTTDAPAPQVSAPPVTKPDVVKPVATVTPKPAVKPVTSAVPAAVTSPVVASAPASGASVQIGAFTSTDIATQQYNTVASSYGLFLSGTAKHIEKVQAANGATLYRTSFTGFASKDKAHAFCSALKAAGRDCFVK